MDKAKTIPTLFLEKGQCSGCMACVDACPVNAIETIADECGYLYPRIDARVCIRCKRCERVCGFRRKDVSESRGPFYAAAANDGLVLRSSSGGVFGALARAVVSQGGTVFGCRYEMGERGIFARHARTDSLDGIDAFLGSKYVQSSTARVFRMVKKELDGGCPVLFSGTPCQVAGLRGYLGRDYSNLVTVDLVCHGVPNGAMFHSYLLSVEERLGQRVIDARFRSKRNGWDNSLLLDITFEDGSHKFIASSDSSYYDLFLGLLIFRDSCYECPFAGGERPGDLTIGDFWGIEKVRPDLVSGAQKALFNVHEGVSCLLVNSEYGERWLGLLGDEIKLEPVSFAEVAQGNDQLRAPSKMPKRRRLYLMAYKRGGWRAVEQLWRLDSTARRMGRTLKRAIKAGLSAFRG